MLKMLGDIYCNFCLCKLYEVLSYGKYIQYVATILYRKSIYEEKNEVLPLQRLWSRAI